jgi:hypothetical protein
MQLSGLIAAGLPAKDNQVTDSSIRKILLLPYRFFTNFKDILVTSCAYNCLLAEVVRRSPDGPGDSSFMLFFLRSILLYILHSVGSSDFWHACPA